MSVYLDTSVLASLFVQDVNSPTATRRLRQLAEDIVISDFGAAEFASAVSKRVRVRDISASDAKSAFTQFDAWTSAQAQQIEVTPQDIAACATLLRRLDSALRTPDALHIATVQRLGVKLFTFDAAQRTYARKVGIDIV